MANLRKSRCELYQQLEGLHVNIGDDALLKVLHRQLHKVRTPGSMNHLVVIEHLLLTQELLLRQLASLEHGQQGGVGVVKLPFLPTYSAERQVRHHVVCWLARN